MPTNIGVDPASHFIAQGFNAGQTTMKEAELELLALPIDDWTLDLATRIGVRNACGWTRSRCATQGGPPCRRVDYCGSESATTPGTHDGPSSLGLRFRV